MNSITRKTVSSFVLIFSMFVSVFSGFLLIPSTVQAAGTTRYVSTSGSDSGNCTSSPCRTITYGISQLQGGDTLIVGNGFYNDPFRNIPSGSAGAYTTIKAESDFGVTVNASTYPAPDIWGKIGSMYNSSYITIRGFKFYGPGAPGPTGGSHHIKFIRNVFAYGDVNDNTTLGSTGPSSDYVLFEENVSYGGGRYMYMTYQSDHTVYRRNVGRNDYYTGGWQSASFTSYDSNNTAWINNIALDSNKNCCRSFFYGGHWNEKNLTESKTNQRFLGNIILNVHTDFPANNDSKASGSRIMMDNIYWDTDGGYLGQPGPGDAASYDLMTNFTAGGSNNSQFNNGSYTTFSGVYIEMPSLVKNSIFANNKRFGVSGNVTSRNNAFSGNGSNYEGSSGSGDITNINIVGNVLKYLPRGPEPGTTLASGGDNGGRIGAQVMWKIGVDGTLWGEPGWDVVRSPENGYGRAEDRLWPFPNEAFIKQEMASASYPGGLQGQRGFAASGSGLYGGPITLTSYIWEYLGSPMPSYDQMYSNLPINPPTVTPTPRPTTNPTPTPTPFPTVNPTPIPTTQPTPTPTGGKFTVGQRVQTTDNLNVRNAANLTSTLLGTQLLGSVGTVTGGPTSQGGYIWWNINYDSGVDGWSVENFLTPYSLAPTPLPTPLSQIPPPTNLVLSCPAPGNVLTATWRIPSGYSSAYIRANVGANNDAWPSLIQVPEISPYTGTTFSFYTTPGQTYYVWLNTKDSATGNYSLLPADGNVTCQFSDMVVPTPTPTSQGPAGYTFCANEYESCNFTGTKTVAYGLNGTYTYKQFTNGIGCSNANFTDPLPGVDKACFVTSSSPTPTPFPTVNPTPIPTTQPTPTPTGGKFTVGQRVQTTANLNVRDLPSTTGTILGAQPLASQGMVMSGPMQGGGYSWWYIIYDTGIAGWSVENYLAAIGVVTPTPTPTPPSGSPTGPVGYTFCAYEYGTCTFSGTRRVAYGLNGSYTYKDLNSPVTCGNSTFTDPLVGVDKACFVSQFTSTPAPTVTPIPTVIPTVRPSVTPIPTIQPTPTPIPTTTPGGFSIGSNIIVTGTVNVRSQPVTTSLIQGTQNTGATGTIIDGPVNQGGYTWWRIDYSTGADGWSIESALAVTGTGPQPTPTPGTISGPSGYTFCANEYETCNFSAGASVAFGSNGSYNYKTFITNSVPCTTGNFGDPLPGANKGCFYKAGVVSPTPTPTTQPTGATLFPANSWFYRDISNYPLDAENSLVINALNRVNWGFGALRVDFSIDVLKADQNTPYVKYTPNSETYIPDCDRVPMPLPVGGNVEAESGYQCTQDGDCHLLVIDPYKNLLIEMFRAGAPASQSSTSNFYGGCQVVWDTTKTVTLAGRGEMCTSADAAGYPIVPLLVNADEVYDAVYNGKPINHALRFILPNDRIRFGWYLHPATHTPGPALSGDVDMPPYGTLLRLRADYPLQNLPNEAARAVARAMQKYGMYLSDGGNIALTFQSDQHTTHKWSDLNFDSRTMVGLTPADFQMVDGGSRYKDLQSCTRTQITSLP